MQPITIGYRLKPLELLALRWCVLWKGIIHLSLGILSKSYEDVRGREIRLGLEFTLKDSSLLGQKLRIFGFEGDIWEDNKPISGQCQSAK